MDLTMLEHLQRIFTNHTKGYIRNIAELYMAKIELGEAYKIDEVEQFIKENTIRTASLTILTVRLVENYLKNN